MAYYCSGCGAEPSIALVEIITGELISQCCNAPLQDEEGNEISAELTERWLDRGAMAQERE